MTEYAERDLRELDDYYYRHVNAMTGEKLHSKSAIAAELAYRDKRIAELEAFVEKQTREWTEQRREIHRLKAENAELRERLAHMDEQYIAPVSEAEEAEIDAALRQRAEQDQQDGSE